MLKYGKQQGYMFEGDLKRAINSMAGFAPDEHNPDFLLNEEMIKKKFGTCISSKGKPIVGVDILCVVNYEIYAIQCKQYADKVPKQCVQDFIDYCKFLEQKIGKKIIKIWSSSQESTESGNILGNENELVWIIYPNTKALVINTVDWIFRRKFTVDDDCDLIME